MKSTFLIIFVSIFVVSGCNSVNDKTEFIINTTSERASVKTARELSRLFKNNYFFKGTVVKVEEHPISWLSSSGTHAITYHVEYKLDGALSPSYQKDKEIEPLKYTVPISTYGMEPKYKVGDEVEITGWIDNSANHSGSTNPTSSSGRP